MKMTRYLFALHYNENGKTKIGRHEESFLCDADAQVRAREILKEGKRDVQAFLIALYRQTKSGSFVHVVSYE